MPERKPSSRDRDPSGRADALELERLRDQALVVWPTERRVLGELGLRDGMTVLDAGCGPGTVTAKLAELCPRSALWGLDPDPERVELAREAVASRPAVSIERGRLSNNALAESSFDFVYARFLLQQVSEPQAELEGALRLLRPGGILVAVDADDGLFAIHPQPPELAEAIRLSQALQRERGGDRRVGRKLGTLLEQAGFSDVSTRAFAVTSSDLGHGMLARLAVSFRLRRLRERHRDAARQLVEAVERFLDTERWHGVVCILAARGVRP